MLRKAFFLLLVFFIQVAFKPYASAQEYITRAQYEELEKRVIALEEKLIAQDKCIVDQQKCILDQNNKLTEYESKLTQFDTALHRQEGAPITIAEGLQIGAGGTMIIQGTNNVNNASAGIQRKSDRTDASYSADITIGKEFLEAGGKAFLHLEAGTGEGLNDDLTLYSSVNRDADNDNNVRVSELWYEQALCKDKAALTLGKLDPTAYFDNNEAANDETTQFLGSIFRNSPAIEFPDNTVGIRAAYLPWEWLEVSYGLFDGDSDWEKVGDNLFNIGQVAFKTDISGLPGNYRFLGWHNNVYHTRWLSAEREKEAAFGFGLSFDQKLNGITTAFLRYGWQDPKVYNPGITATGDLNYSLEHSWSAGLQFEGKSWGRDKDIFAFAIGQIFPSGDYKKAGEFSDPERRGKAEGHLEAYYRIYANDHLSITPDFQYIWNPFGKDVPGDTSGIFVAGMRAQIDF